MKKLKLDSGAEVFSIPGGGNLRFNPADPALHLRLEQLEDRMKQLPIEKLSLPELDRQIKGLLDWALGAGNDVDRALGGVSVLAPGKNGRSVLKNLLDALGPILREGAEECARQQEKW